MSGYVQFKTPGSTCAQCQQQVSAVVKTVRSLAKRRKIKLPARLNMSGAWFDYATINFSSNAIKDIILEACSLNNLAVIGYRSNGNWNVVSDRQVRPLTKAQKRELGIPV